MAGPIPVAGANVTRHPLALTRSLIAAYRPGRLVAVALGQPVSLPRRRARGYQRRRGADSYPIGGSYQPAPASTVGVVDVRGVLEQRASIFSCGESAGYDEITERALAANADPSVAAVVLALDSPGGDVAGLSECARRIRAAYDASGKPLLAFCDEMAASAGYYLACACDGIYAPPSGLVGSIGELFVHATEARALEAEGIDVTVVRAPDGKARPSDVEPLDDVGRARIAAIVDAGCAEFFAHVSARRGVPVEAVRALDGALLLAPDALAAGLLTGIGSLEDTIALAASLAPKGIAA